MKATSRSTLRIDSADQGKPCMSTQSQHRLPVGASNSPAKACLAAQLNQASNSAVCMTHTMTHLLCHLLGRARKLPGKDLWRNLPRLGLAASVWHFCSSLAVVGPLKGGGLVHYLRHEHLSQLQPAPISGPASGLIFPFVMFVHAVISMLHERPMNMQGTDDPGAGCQRSSCAMIADAGA